MSIEQLLQQIRTLGVELKFDSGKVQIKNAIVLSAELRQNLREHREEVERFLETEEIARRLTEDGCVLLRSEMLGDLIAFVKAGHENKVPAGFVIYTEAELYQLFGSDVRISQGKLKLIHEAKKMGAIMTIDKDETK